MGWETGNIHLANREVAKAIRKHLAKQKSTWLYSAAREMAAVVKRDWQFWRKSRVT